MQVVRTHSDDGRQGGSCGCGGSEWKYLGLQSDRWDLDI